MQKGVSSTRFRREKWSPERVLDSVNQIRIYTMVVQVNVIHSSTNCCSLRQFGRLWSAWVFYDRANDQYAAARGVIETLFRLIWTRGLIYRRGKRTCRMGTRWLGLIPIFRFRSGDILSSIEGLVRSLLAHIRYPSYWTVDSIAYLVVAHYIVLILVFKV